jgi:hypothetical protein
LGSIANDREVGRVATIATLCFEEVAGRLIECEIDDLRGLVKRLRSRAACVGCFPDNAKSHARAVARTKNQRIAAQAA